MQLKFLSVIIPVYRFQASITQNLEHFKSQLKKIKSPYLKGWEIIVVVDGTQEDKTYEYAKRVRGVKTYGYKNNRGKGYALLQGFKHAKGDYLLFLDADGDLQPRQIVNFFPYFTTGDVLIGSKRHPFSKITYPTSRKILSRGFQFLSRIILGSTIKDTQSGIKIIKREVLDVISDSMKIYGFAFDLELCFLSQKHGFRIIEVPIEVEFKGGSTVRLKDIFRMLFDLIRVRYLYTFKRHYQHKFHKRKFPS